MIFTTRLIILSSSKMARMEKYMTPNTNWRLHHDHPTEKMLGSGSDYTVFLDHFGISSLDFSFGKKTTYGQYHSIYDSFDWMETFGGTDGESGSFL
jgi:hypothetical protein